MDELQLKLCDIQPVIFVYAIRDDMFKDSERTKFFDFIIPVIPIINSTNSSESLLEMLQNSLLPLPFLSWHRHCRPSAGSPGQGR